MKNKYYYFKWIQKKTTTSIEVVVDHVATAKMPHCVLMLITKGI
jgi:hypothetical protein